MTETVRYLEMRLVATPHLVFPTNKNNEVFYVPELGHMLLTKKQIHPTPIEHIDSHKNYVYILFDLPVLVVTVTGWVVDPMYIYKIPATQIDNLFTYSWGSFGSKCRYIHQPLSVCVYTYIAHTLCIQPNIKSK